jgi:hypothetical protein
MPCFRCFRSSVFQNLRGKRKYRLTLSLTGVGPSGPALTYMQIPLKVQKVRYRQKLGIPQAGSWACFKIKTVPI